MPGVSICKITLLALFSAAPAVAQGVTFPCQITDVCAIAGTSVTCDPESGGWSGDWKFIWDGASFSVESPRGTFHGELNSQPEAWPIVITVTADDSPMPGWVVLYETSEIQAALPPEPRGGSEPLEMLNLQGRCGSPE